MALRCGSGRGSGIVGRQCCTAESLWSQVVIVVMFTLPPLEAQKCTKSQDTEV